MMIKIKFHSSFNRQAQKGISIIECLVYCALLTLLATVSFNWIFKTHTIIKEQNSKNNQTIGLGAVSDFIIRELRAAPSLKTSWKKIESHEIIWTQGDFDIGWTYEKGQLIRYQGKYSQDLDQWSEKSKSIISSAIKKLDISFKTHKKQQLEWVTQVKIAFDSQTIMVALRNGVVQ